MPCGGCGNRGLEQRPLHFVRSSPRNGATGVSPNLRTILLVFDKNVTADSVWNNNREQIRLYRGDVRIARRVFRSSLFANRNNIYVRPVFRLRSFTNYRVVIRPGLRARNGDTLGETITIRFRTGGRTT